MSSLEQVNPNTVDLLKEQVSIIIAEAKKQGATDCEVSASAEQGISVSVRQKAVDTLEFNYDQGFGITVYLGQRKGSASTSVYGLDAIKETVAAALAIAKYTSEDKHAGLPDASLMAKEIIPLDLYHSWDITPEEAIEQALVCEQAAFDVDKRITNTDGTSLNTHKGCRVYGNSRDFLGGYASTRHSFSCTMIAEQNNQKQRDYWYDINCRHDLLMSAISLGEKSAVRTLRRLNSKSILTGKAPVLFSAEIASSLFGHFFRAISGSSIYKKTSFLQDTLGKKVFPEWLSLNEQPHLLQKLGSSWFDADGLPTYKKNFVEQGILSSYALSTYSGRQLGLKSTANAGGIHNIFVTPGIDNLQALIKKMHRGLLVTELMGQGVNLITGDYSRGASGFWIENGEIQHPVEEITIAGNLRDMFQKIVAIGSDLEQRGAIFTGSVLIEDMMIASS
ncbi:UNVERIFIED_CONTAM: hypothetical protein GTU68_056357 [Idotea baltica]|nr:hypothetical protein [Idotea baltica]